MVSFSQVIAHLNELEMERFDFICSCREDELGADNDPNGATKEDEEELLTDASNAGIPGGRRHEAEPMFISHKISKSIPKSRRGEDISASGISL
ncbi:expressed unknown protein [Seminavis robusta]|uniref:Uncharacterized protein n=1 Tax=Seminavis robusta TaxID=568900 RepID=A0A9N8DD38_9STRA|nr:expressed unknown protein [Seminavis robusta]|eukprot:Sro68_g038080.1 n/a (94) ;mRNA; f:54123-54404